MHEDWRKLKPVKRKSLRSTQVERDEFDKMFWDSVDPGFSPEDNEHVCSTDHGDIEQSRSSELQIKDASDSEEAEDWLTKMIQERKEKYA